MTTQQPRPWEYRAAPRQDQAAPLAAQEAELLCRHHLGFMDARAHARLEALFAEPPADIAARLTKTCAHLGVTAEHAELYALAADYRNVLERLEHRISAGQWPIRNPGVLKTYLKRARGGDTEALCPVLTYLAHEAVADELLSSPTS